MSDLRADMRDRGVGAWLCRRLEDGSVVRRRITETEAYCGEIWYNERNPLKGGGR